MEMNKSIYGVELTKLENMLNNDKLEGIKIEQIITESKYIMAYGKSGIQIMFTQFGSSYEVDYRQVNGVYKYILSKRFGFTKMFENYDKLNELLTILNNFEKECCALANSVSEERYYEEVKTIRKKYNNIIKRKKL